MRKVWNNYEVAIAIICISQLPINNYIITEKQKWLGRTINN